MVTLQKAMQRTKQLLFLLLCSCMLLLVVLLSRQSLVVFSTKPFRTFTLRQSNDSVRGVHAATSTIGLEVETRLPSGTSLSEHKARTVRVKPQACVPPPIHPYDPSLSGVLESHPALSCAGGLPSVVTYSVQGDELRLTVDTALVSRRLGTAEPPYCRYRAISVTPGGDFNTTSTPWSEVFRESIVVDQDQEHVVVACYRDKDLSRPLVAKSYISVVRERPRLEESLAHKLGSHLRQNAPREVLNVILLGVDGMSKQNMVRTLPKTRDFLLRGLKAKEMLNYNKNGMNTFPNVITLLTGQTVAEISQQYSWTTAKFFDSIPFIWDEFAGAGYRTQVALDSSRVTSFHCSKQGFSRPPVHYYHRPLVLHSEPDPDVRHKDGNCVGDTPEVTLLLDYVLQMASVFGVPRSANTSKSAKSDQHQVSRNRLEAGNTVSSIRRGEENTGIDHGRTPDKPDSSHDRKMMNRSKDLNKLPSDRRQQRPFFSYNFFVRLTHDNPQRASAGDEIYAGFFRSLNNTGVLNSSLLIFFSDHGPRFGPLRRTVVGIMEDRMPFCLLVFPPWFLHKYPDVERALTTNQNRLTSHFDIHATLRHILRFDGGGNSGRVREAVGVSDVPRTGTTDHSSSTSPRADTLDTRPARGRGAAPQSRGLSLLREIPRERTCGGAGIDFQWCSCNRLLPVSTEDPLVRLLALEFSLLLSDKTARARHLCHQLNLASIRSAIKVTLEEDASLVDGETPMRESVPPGRRFSKLLAPVNATLGDSNSNPAIEDPASIYLLSIETKPGGAVFEGHLEFSVSEGTVRLLGTVLRLNMFQPQSMCVEEPGLKPFCYCKDLDEKTGG